MSEKLLPCPFCGHDTPEFERMGDRRQSCIVICGWCGARHESSDEGDRCGSSWNQRAEPSQDGLRTALETALARIEDMLADDD
jgi:Lar family restriction alleviation protein